MHDDARGGLVESLAVTDPLLGRTIADKYQIIRRLGAGGMGAVYHARHKQTGGDCAVKFLHGTAVGDESAVRRFQLEAQNAAALRHTNTIRVTDFGVDGGLLYLVMEYLEGGALSDILQERGPMAWRRAVHVARQVLKSLWEAHEHARHIIHRDIKPANIFLVDLPGETDHVRVLDFGISRSLAGSGAGTQGLLGTPFYMAPELWRGETVDARTDLYALGCVMFQMLAGTPPFVPPPSAGDSLFPLLEMHLHTQPPVLGNLVAGVPRAIAAYVDTLLAKDPADRPASAREALEALDRAAVEARAEPVPELGETLDAPRRPLPKPAPLPVPATITANPRPRAPQRRSQAWLGWVVSGLLLVGVGVAAAIALSGSKDEPAQPTHAPATLALTQPELDFDHGDPDEPIEPVVVDAPFTHPTFGNKVFAYRARLSQGDHIGNDGRQFLRAGEIIARDRGRYHSGQFDTEDQPDFVFADPSTLEEYAALVEPYIDATLKHDIISGTPLVEIIVYSGGLVVREVSN